MAIKNRKNICVSLSKFDYLAKDSHFVEVTEWANSEGFDITIGADTDRIFSLTHGQIEAISFLSKCLNNGIDINDEFICDE